ncbi:hypothetical protein [Mycolicibacterium brumae]|uniref:Uncharacterized protein n=1 Tax=Mycolicibacterium brumae TaxID=85968 RepID=A0A2G5P800_9MYCO|nr:hypothetical protein [Mycolicibacterium brumae]MCV7194121.1 hypothetical protein [Mycolicibacterium brumae]PIB74435.1 hypothetical protein CQY22_013280 [Mycolicibacterium brumae]RWA22706.1 hypothetical protein MBRU_12210 [Mycolicibacterium brumae DSM 44177]UWW07488.1 hypothetical protein L2Z93_000503 [Mycolicibacterium brumae]
MSIHDIPLAPAADCGGVHCPTLHEVVGVGSPGTTGALDQVAEYLNAMGSHVPWYATPGAVVALITITVMTLMLAGLIGYRVHAARSAR